jgi:hypothetical protein
VLAQLRARSASKSGLSAADAEEQLRLVLRLLPAWARLDHPQGVSLADMRVVVRIHRRTPWADLRRLLSERVAAARVEAVPAAGADAEAAAAAEAADLTAAALDAAVARAAAAAAAQEGAAAGGAGAEAEEEAGQDGGEEPDAVAADAQPAADQQQREAGYIGGAEGTPAKVAPEALTACLKARVWGQQRSGSASP